jgi:glycosyltransferase involved in cell wall biosynthesis
MLFSVVVITYNSADYIIEALDSVYNQTYSNIELVITDDCSGDTTVSLCEHWLKEHSNRFFNSKLIVSGINRGITGNCNIGIRESSGSWVKLLAGDDVLLPTCIADGRHYISENGGTQIFASNVFYFEKLSEASAKKCSNMGANLFFQEPLDIKKQFRIMIAENPILAPSVFFSRLLYDTYDGFDEEVSYMEDYPFWIKILKRGVAIQLLSKVTVGYRIHEKSISGHEKEKIFNRFYRSHFDFQKRNTFQYMSWPQRMNSRYLFWIKSVFDMTNLNNSNYLLLYKLILRLNVFRFFCK